MRIFTVLCWITLILESHSLNPIPHSYFSNHIARSKFCSQKQFHSASFDGESYKFTVNRRVADHHTGTHRYIFEEFKLRYIAELNQFNYSSAKYDSNNLVVYGGFYIDSLNLFVEFYQDRTDTIDARRRYSYCPYYDIPRFNRHNCTRCDSPKEGELLHLCDWRFIGEQCRARNGATVTPTIFPEKLADHLHKSSHVAFAYDSNQQKLLYIFSDRTSPSVMSLLRLTDSTMNRHWFTKNNRYPQLKFVGSFNWKSTDKENKIYLLVERDWKPRDLVLRELIDTKSFTLSSQEKSWKEFFGCTEQHRLGEPSFRWSKRATSRFAFIILSLSSILALFLLFVFIANIFPLHQYAAKMYTSINCFSK